MIVTRSNAAGLLDSEVQPALWTAVVPAAGRGSRLGFDRPKILYPIAGRTILEWLADLLLPVSSKIVLVLSPEGSAAAGSAARRMIGDRLAIAVQAAPVGMADAIACALPLVETPNTLIVWGDQVAIRSESLDFSMRLHQGDARPAATVPTLWRERPYIHFDRSAAGSLERVLQAREGDSLPDRGESDSGVFLFRTEALRRHLAALLGSEKSIGARTGERNFLPIFPMIERAGERLITASIMSEAESVGINSPADAEYLERRLAASPGSEPAS